MVGSSYIASMVNKETKMQLRLWGGGTDEPLFVISMEHLTFKKDPASLVFIWWPTSIRNGVANSEAPFKAEVSMFLGDLVYSKSWTNKGI